MFSYRNLSLIFLLIIIFLLVLLGGTTIDAYPNETDWDKVERPSGPVPRFDPVINLLGKSFTEIKCLLGEPDAEGFSHLYGTHHYISYNHERGGMHFCSPPDAEEEIAVLIILEAGQEVMQTKVGMSFKEIQSVLGEPDYGPLPGKGNAYYMDYYFGQADNGVPEVFLSFSARTPGSPTSKAFIKWEAYYTN